MMLHPGTPNPHSHSSSNEYGSGKDDGNGSSWQSLKSSYSSASNKKQGDYLTALAIMRPRVLDYDVHSCSSYSASYLPENIKTNNPQDQSSRWSSGSNNQMQYIMIKLKSMAIAHTITFGKYYKVHVCNLKEFKVFGGLTTSNMTELLHTGLRNDNEPETFLLKHKSNSMVFPCQYIKIVPLMAWGPNFNFSVWHVEVKGIPDTELVQDTYFQYINFRETESVRLCLKHFRQRKLFDAFKALQDRTNIQLEDNLLTRLHHEVVIKGNFKQAEELMAEAAGRGLFDEYIRSYDYKPIWKRLCSSSHRQGVHHHHHSHQVHTDDSPRHRGGHQMCIDAKGGYVYLMGGWDGARDLADFWAYHISTQKWILISADTSLQGGPSARSCHKICYSPQHRAIFLLGKYVDPDNRSKADLSSDFWRFDIDPVSPPHGRWTKISGNTAIMNGPELIYDHQMCLDPVSQTLYVFGGRVVHMDRNAHLYSGLYSYHVLSGIWRLLRADDHPPPKQDGSTVLRSRIGHSMLYDDLTRSLVIFAGQMNKDYLSDFYVYDIAADRVIEVCKDYNKQGGPEAGFTQRATISPRGREVYVLSGLVKDRTLGAETVKNSFWVFKLPGRDQMDAIRDVQLALANAKTSGSIGSLKSIMNQGQSLPEFIEPVDPYRPNPYRRKSSNEDQQGRQELRSGSRRISIRSGNTSTDPLSSTAGVNSGAEYCSTRTIQTRSTSYSRKMSLRSGSNSLSSVISPTQSLRSGNDPLVAHEAPTQSAINSKEGAISGLLSTTPSITLLPSPDQGYGLSNRRSPTLRANSSAFIEPMSLAYVLSDQGSWQKIFQNSSPELGEPSELEPVPRYAHQLVYDELNEVQYLFGGNPGEQGNMSKRLDDFWELRLYRPKPDEIVRKAKYLLRTQQFKELCQRPETSALTSTTILPTTSDTVELADSSNTASQSDRARQTLPTSRYGTNGNTNTARAGAGAGAGPRLVQSETQEHQNQSSKALKFLQTELSCVVDQSNKAESEDFKALLRGLLLGAFSPSARKPSFSCTGTKSSTLGSDVSKTTVPLTHSPIASPSLGRAQLMFPTYPTSGQVSEMRSFLVSPNCDYQEIPTFNAGSHRGESEREDEDSPMDGSSASRRVLNRSRRRRRSTHWIEVDDLDNNGEKIKPLDNVNAQDIDGDGNDNGVEDNKLVDDGSRMDEDEAMDIEDEMHDEVMREFYRERTLLYERLLEFFADESKQPKGDLTDLVKVG
ncbi:Muskelin 1, intracellular mediator containing kelch motif [Mortierella sp. AM989]|nr:Muskelin 1, intracellular mediator containing kelch motif [Mortierella sp. AM989]